MLGSWQRLVRRTAPPWHIPLENLYRKRRAIVIRCVKRAFPRFCCRSLRYSYKAIAQCAAIKHVNFGSRRAIRTTNIGIPGRNDYPVSSGPEQGKPVHGVTCVGRSTLSGRHPVARPGVPPIMDSSGTCRRDSRVCSRDCHAEEQKRLLLFPPGKIHGRTREPRPAHRQHQKPGGGLKR